MSHWCTFWQLQKIIFLLHKAPQKLTVMVINELGFFFRPTQLCIWQVSDSKHIAHECVQFGLVRCHTA